MTKRWVTFGVVVGLCAGGSLAACGGSSTEPGPGDDGGLEASSDAGSSSDSASPSDAGSSSDAVTSADAAAEGGATPPAEAGSEPDSSQPDGATQGDSSLPDGGGIDSSLTGDAGDGSASTDGGADVDGDAYVGLPNPATIVFLHAAPGVPAFRLCLATVNVGITTVVPLTAWPDRPTPTSLGLNGAPGVPPGSIVGYPTPADLTTLVIRPYLITNVAAIAGDQNPDGGPLGVSPDGGYEETCQTLIGKHGDGGRLTPNQDFWQLPDWPAGALLDDTTYLLSLTGCLPGVGGDAGQSLCGSTYSSGSGNMRFEIAKLDTSTTAPSAGLGAQFANVSSALEGTAYVGSGAAAGVVLHGPASAGLVPGFLAPNPDGGAAQWLPLVPGGGGVGYGGTAVVPAAAAAMNVAPAGASFGVLTVPGSGPGGAPSFRPYPGTYETNPDGGAPTWVPGDLIAAPLSVVSQVSDWSDSIQAGSSPATFTKGLTYTFALVGNPLDAPLDADGGTTIDPAYNGGGLHIVAFPNAFAPPLQ